jgi:hypothetical protein
MGNGFADRQHTSYVIRHVQIFIPACEHPIVILVGLRRSSENPTLSFDLWRTFIFRLSGKPCALPVTNFYRQIMSSINERVHYLIIMYNLQSACCIVSIYRAGETNAQERKGRDVKEMNGSEVSTCNTGGRNAMKTEQKLRAHVVHFICSPSCQTVSCNSLALCCRRSRGDRTTPSSDSLCSLMTRACRFAPPRGMEKKL